MEIKIILALGNPGEEYKNTYHNAGRLMLDDWLERLEENALKKERNFEFAKTDNFILAKSLAYMNESGKAVQTALKKFKIKPANLLVIHDDSDIILGEYKVSFNRGAAGHNGIASIIKALGTKEFWRLRIGIRQKPRASDVRKIRLRAGDFVLKKIASPNKKILGQVFDRAFAEIFLSS